MSFNEKTKQMDWKDECVWMVISVLSGVLLWLVFSYVERFPDASHIAVLSLSIIGFYVLSILIRIQNHRGEILTGKTAFPEKNLKWVFPVFGFLIGLALLIF